MFSESVKNLENGLKEQTIGGFFNEAVEFAKTLPHEGKGWFCNKCGELFSEGHPCKPEARCERNGFDAAFMVDCPDGKSFFAGPTAYDGDPIIALDVGGVRFQSWRYEKVGRESGGEVKEPILSVAEASQYFPICVGNTIWVKGKQFELPDPEGYSNNLPRTWIGVDHDNFDRARQKFPSFWTDHAKKRFLQEAWNEENKKLQKK